MSIPAVPETDRNLLLRSRMYSTLRGWGRIAFRSHSVRPHPARLGGGRQQPSFAGFLAVLPHRQERRRAAAVERPGHAREEARFQGEPGRRRPVPDRRPPPNFDLDKVTCLEMGLCGWSMVPGY